MAAEPVKNPTRLPEGIMASPPAPRVPFGNPGSKASYLKLKEGLSMPGGVVEEIALVGAATETGTRVRPFVLLANDIELAPLGAIVRTKSDPERPERPAMMLVSWPMIAHALPVAEEPAKS